MDGTKATHLEETSVNAGRAYTRMDYRGHGRSDGCFEDGTITRWRDDVLSIIDMVTTSSKLVLVGSSMGGWLAMLAALARPDRVRGFIGIAAAPDFTADIYDRLSDDQRSRLRENGRLWPETEIDMPFVITRDLIADGEQHRLLNTDTRIDLDVACLVQGKRDDAVAWTRPYQIRQLFVPGVGETVFIPDGDHRLSRPADLAILARALDNVCARVAGYVPPAPFSPMDARGNRNNTAG